MEKIIWVVGNDKKEMIELQKRINSSGSMRAFCMLSHEAVKKAVLGLAEDAVNRKNAPSLIILDYRMDLEENFAALSCLKINSHLQAFLCFLW